MHQLLFSEGNLILIMSQYLINSFLLEPFSSPQEHYFHAFISLGWALTLQLPSVDACRILNCWFGCNYSPWITSQCLSVLQAAQLCLQLGFFAFPLISLLAEKSKALAEVRDVIHITSTEIIHHSSIQRQLCHLSYCFSEILKPPELKLFCWQRFFI